MKHWDIANINSQLEQLNQQYVACLGCDELLPRPRLREGQTAKCPRCGSTVLTYRKRAFDRVLAAMVASLVLLTTAVAFPFLHLERAGLKNQISLLDAVTVLWKDGMPFLSLLAGLFIVIIPLTQILLLIGIYIRLRMGKRLGKFGAEVLKLTQHLEPWSMAEIFLIGVVVSLVKVGSLANVGVGPSFWALAALMVVMTYSQTVVCRSSVWLAVDKRL